MFESHAVISSKGAVQEITLTLLNNFFIICSTRSSASISVRDVENNYISISGGKTSVDWLN